MTLEQLSSLITNSTEIVMVAMAFFSALFAGVQTFLLFKTLEVAKEYLPQHREKVKEERRIELIKSTKEKITLFRLTADSLYEIPQSILNDIDAPQGVPMLIIEDFFSDFFKRKKSESVKLKELAAFVSSNLALLKRDDLQKKWFNCHSDTVGLDLFLSRSTLDHIRSLTSESSKINKFKGLPRSFSLGNHHINQDVRHLLKEIQGELTKMYHY